VRIRQRCKPEGVSLSPRRRRTSCAAAAIRAEVSFVEADEAKRLVAEEGFTVLDIRDRTQRERAYIKSSTHVPLFIENQDNDIGMGTTACISCKKCYALKVELWPWVLKLVAAVLRTFSLILFCCQGTIVKRQVHNNFAGLFFGLPFTKLNPDFTKAVKEKFSPESKLLVVCQEGLRFVTQQSTI